MSLNEAKQAGTQSTLYTHLSLLGTYHPAGEFCTQGCRIKVLGVGRFCRGLGGERTLLKLLLKVVHLLLVLCPASISLHHQLLYLSFQAQVILLCIGQQRLRAVQCTLQNLQTLSVTPMLYMLQSQQSTLPLAKYSSTSNLDRKQIDISFGFRPQLELVMYLVLPCSTQSLP